MIQGTLTFYPYEGQVVQWFPALSADAKEYACSFCGKPIVDAAVCRWRNGPDGTLLTARFHDECERLVDRRHFE